MLTAFLHGVILAFGLIIPLGIQNVFIFNQGVTQPKFIHALPSILTAFICDAILISLAVLGMSLIILQFAWLKLFLFVLGFGFLLFMGFVIWNTKPSAQKKYGPFSTKRQITFALTVSLLNPHAILDTIAVIGTNALNYYGHHKWLFTFGCILVSFIWFFTVAALGHFTHKFDKKGLWLNSINKVSAIVIWGVSLYLLWQMMGDLKTLLSIG